MREDVSEGEPGGARGEVEMILRTVCLEIGVALQVLVEVEHELVIGGAGNNGKTEALEPGGCRKAELSVCSDLLEACVVRILFRENGEGVGCDPVAGFRWMDVGEDAQDEIAVGGARGKGVGVDQVIARVIRQVAAFFFERTEAGVIEFPGAGVSGQQLTCELDDGPRVLAHHGKEALTLRVGRFDTGDAVGGGAVRDVFMNGVCGK